MWRLTRRRGVPVGHTVADMADDVAQVIDEAFDGHVDAVVGLSLGGVVAQFLAARHPGAVGSLVLVSSAAGPTARAVESARRYGEALGHGRFAGAGAVALEDAVPGVWFGPVRRLLGVLMGRMLGLVGRHPADVLVETVAVIDVDTRLFLPQITAPSSSSSGTRTTTSPPRSSTRPSGSSLTAP